MSSPGPIPKRSEERIRRNKSDRTVSKSVGQAVKPYPTPAGWHKNAKQIYQAMAKSGQARYMQQTDWALAYAVISEFSAMLNDERKFSGIERSELWKQLNGLLLSEGERRRARIELTPDSEPETEMDDSAEVAKLYAIAMTGNAEAEAS